MDPMISLVIKVQQFEDKRITARASWNIRELKGKLSEIYPTSTEEQKLIYSGKLLNDTVILKDVLREYEGQEAHTVHLVFTPKQSARLQSKQHENKQNSPVATSQTSSSSSAEMASASELRQRHTATAAAPAASVSEQTPQQTASANIPPSNYFNAFYGNTMDANSILAQQYAMQTWMQQAYAQYMNQYMTMMSTQSEQQAHQTPNFAFMQPPMPSMPAVSTAQSPNGETQAAPVVEQQAQPQNQQPAAAAEPQRRFPNIIQDEQENRDWLDILYSMSRLMILMCLVYFYSSPLRCIIVVLIALSIYLYHIYRQNQNRLNNNNTNRVNLNNVNNNRPAAAPPAAGAQQNEENAPESNEENQESSSHAAENGDASVGGEGEPLVTASEVTENVEPPVPLLTVVRTFVISFVASIIPDHPAM